MNTNQVKPQINPFLFLLILSIYLSCSVTENNKEQIANDSITVDSSKLAESSEDDTIQLEKEASNDSSEIFVLSTSGKLIERIAYKTEKDEYIYFKHANYIEGYPKDDTIIGDFNGDRKKEKAWFIDRGDDAYNECRDNQKKCTGVIQFSDKTIQQLYIANCPTWTFKNEGDLNSDGKDEIGVLPGWFGSGCRIYQVFTLKDNKWIQACNPISNTYNMRVAGIVLIRKDKTRKGYAIVREQVYDDSNTKNRGLNVHMENNVESIYFTPGSCAGMNVVEYAIKMK